MVEEFVLLQKSLESITARVQLHLEEPKRLFDCAPLFNRRASILIGPRGVGKTTYLLRQAKERNAFYVSLDNPLLSTVRFFDFADFILQSGFDTIICDEVHFLNDWSVQLKALYDAHPKKKIIATDSSSLILRKGLGDLSRRFVVERINFLNFQEYLYIKHGQLFPSYEWDELFQKNYTSMKKIFTQTNLNLQKEFKEYLSQGTRPFFIEGDYQNKLINTVDKIIYSDIPFFLPEVKERHLQLMKNIIGFLATSPIPSLNIDSLSKNWLVSKSTIYNLLEVMSKSNLIRIIAVENKKNQTKGRKVFFSDPTLYNAYNGDLGNVRESFFSFAADLSGKNIFCPKDGSQADFIIDGKLFEIGGKNKKLKKADFLIRDNIDAPSKGIIPLWLLGFLKVKSN